MRKEGLIWLLSCLVLLYVPFASATQNYLNNSNDVPALNLPEGSFNQNFAKAFDTLNLLIYEVKSDNGFQFYTKPGSSYDGWWQLDQSLHLKAVKWTNVTFAQNVILNIKRQQAIDGTGCLRQQYASNSCKTVLSPGYSSIPMYFYAVKEISDMTDNLSFVREAYESASAYYSWFISKKYDWIDNKRTDKGLAACVWEESIYSMSHNLREYNQICIDTNVHLVSAAEILASLAHRLNDTENETFFLKEAERRKDLITEHLWNNDTKRYQNLDREGWVSYHGVESLYPLKENIAGKERTSYLLKDLQTDTIFNWGTYPLTTTAKTDSDYHIYFSETYNPEAWLGNIWTLPNYDLIKGLKDSGRHDLAAELMYKTISLVSKEAGDESGFDEYFTEAGEGKGSDNYGWTAAEFAVLIIEDLFGIHYAAEDNRITIFPHIPEEYDNQNISIGNIAIPGNKLTVNISRFNGRYRDVSIKLSDTGAYNFTLYIPLPYQNIVESLYLNNAKAEGELVDLDNDGEYEAMKIEGILDEQKASFRVYSGNKNNFGLIIIGILIAGIFTAIFLSNKRKRN